MEATLIENEVGQKKELDRIVNRFIKEYKDIDEDYRDSLEGYNPESQEISIFFSKILTRFAQQKDTTQCEELLSEIKMTLGLDENS